MTQEQKDLLLKDLCSRIPYGVKIDNFGDPSTLISINNTYRIIIEVVDGDKNSSLNLPRLDILNIEDAKPYLFPLSISYYLKSNVSLLDGAIILGSYF